MLVVVLSLLQPWLPENPLSLSHTLTRGLGKHFETVRGERLQKNASNSLDLSCVVQCLGCVSVAACACASCPMGSRLLASHPQALVLSRHGPLSPGTGGSGQHTLSFALFLCLHAVPRVVCHGTLPSLHWTVDIPVILPLMLVSLTAIPVGTNGTLLGARKETRKRKQKVEKISHLGMPQASITWHLREIPAIQHDEPAQTPAVRAGLQCSVLHVTVQVLALTVRRSDFNHESSVRGKGD